MSASASSRTKEETGAAFQLGETIPKMRESDFFSQPQESGQTEEKIRQRLIAGMRGIEGVEAETKDALASSLARKLISLGDGAKIEEKTGEILAALPKIAQAAGKDAGWAFKALSNDKIADLFTKYPSEFVQIAQATGEAASWAFMALSNDKIAGLFASHAPEFVQIAQAAGEDVYLAFEALSNDKIADFFLKDPAKMIASFRGIAQAAGKYTYWAFKALSNDKIADLFTKYPSEFVQIAQATGEAASWAFKALSNDKIADFFLKDPAKLIASFRGIAQAAGKYTYWAFMALSNDKIAGLFSSHAPEFVQIAQAAGEDVYLAFEALSNDKITSDFIAWCEGRLGKEKFLISLLSLNDVAIEIGRPLDDLHNEDLRDPQNKRTAYLNKLPAETVLALLCSNPEFFYTSSNDLLFDRLASDIKNGKFGVQVKTLMDMLAKYGLENTDLHRNLIFRAINYGRFYGGHAPVFGKDDAIKSMETLLHPLKNMQGFDKTYFYLLANSLDGLSPGMKAVVQSELGRCKILSYSQMHLGFQGAKERYAASSFLLDYLKNPREKEVNFDPSKYRGKDGKLEIVQVFSKKDTEKNHWLLSQQWFSKYGKPKTGENGELIYETKNARIVLYMGEDENANQEFVKKKLSENTNMILTFRGHSYSLNDNMPSNIFGNCRCNILFIPGSCGSAGSTPAYIAANPATDLDFISNTSTGKGQVTNALIDILISEDARIRAGGELRTYKAVLNDPANANKIESNDGDPSTLKASSLGEQLLERVYRGN
jgi:hypothetical protein